MISSTLLTEKYPEIKQVKTTPTLYVILPYVSFLRKLPIAEVSAIAVVRQAKATAIEITKVPFLPKTLFEI